MTDQLREYHDALVRLDALMLQLRCAPTLARVAWDEFGEYPAIDNIAKRMDEVIPDAIKATRPAPVAQEAEG